MARKAWNTNRVAQEIHKPDLLGWEIGGPAYRKPKFIRRVFEFDTFEQAMEWMRKVGEVATGLDHHPNWSNVYDTIEVKLQTHDAILGSGVDAGGITRVDFQLARAMNRLFIEITGNNPSTWINIKFPTLE